MLLQQKYTRKKERGKGKQDRELESARGKQKGEGPREGERRESEGTNGKQEGTRGIAPENILPLVAAED